MNKEKLIDAIGMIDDKYIEEAHTANIRKPVFNKAMITRLSLGFLCICLCVGIVPNMFKMGKTKDAATATEGLYSAGNNGYVFNSEMPMEENAVYDSVASDNMKNARKEDATNKKIITTGNMNVETLNLDETLNNLINRVNEYNGYIQSSSISNGTYRYYEATIRIPSASYEEFINDVSGYGNVTYYEKDSNDITDTYNDISARVASLKAQEEKVMEFYKNASTIEELMSIESRLSDIRYEIDSYETRLKNYDVLTDYSTLNINVRETKVYTENKTGFLDRMFREFTSGLSNFIDSIEEMIFFVTYNLFNIVLIGLVCIIGYKGYKKYIRKRN